MSDISDIKGTFVLNNGVEMPYFGLGVFLTKDGQEVENAVKWALEFGYRHIDTAAFYRNEKGVGNAIRASAVNREELFVVSKVWNSDQGYDKTIKAFNHSLNQLEFDYLDLYLVHWPVKGKFVDTWKALETLYDEGKIKAIGVSNFLQHQLEDLMESSSIVPMVNQMEFHPHLQQKDLLNFCKQNQIQYEAWAPLMRGEISELPLLNQLAKKYRKSEAQIVLRWNLQMGIITIPKSSKKERIVSNAEIFDFKLSQDDMTAMAQLDQNRRIGPDPDNFNF